MKHIHLQGIAQDWRHTRAFVIVGGPCPSLCNFSCLPFPAFQHSCLPFQPLLLPPGWPQVKSYCPCFSTHPVPSGGPSDYVDLHQALNSCMRFLSFFKIQILIFILIIFYLHLQNKILHRLQCTCGKSLFLGLVHSTKAGGRPEATANVSKMSKLEYSI